MMKFFRLIFEYCFITVLVQELFTLHFRLAPHDKGPAFLPAYRPGHYYYGDLYKYQKSHETAELTQCCPR